MMTFNLSPRVKAFSTTRHGGCSKRNYASFNINQYCGDAPESVAANRKALCASLGIAEDRLVLPHQTHGTDTRRIDAGFFEMQEKRRVEYLEGVDAVMTDMQNVCIGVSTADCIPIIIYDPERHAACAVHAGWRGTVKRIAEKAVAEMCKAYSSDASRLQACIGPGISLDAFEVGDEVYEEFRHAGFDMPAISRRDKKWHIDLVKCNAMQLSLMGIPAANIETAGICTYSNSDDFFSARKSGIASGRIFTGIVLL